MLLKQSTLKGIRAGTISLAFRRWRRPTVKSGGTLLTSIGQLAVRAVDPVDPDEISESEASAAGFASLEALRAFLDEREGDVYRVRLEWAGPDPRVALREALPDDEEMKAILTRLARLDARSGRGPWTQDTLELIARRPEERAAGLAEEARLDRDVFKTSVRKLKSLGLTESLSVGYRLSPRGRAVLGKFTEGR